MNIQNSCSYRLKTNDIDMTDDRSSPTVDFEYKKTIQETFRHHGWFSGVENIIDDFEHPDERLRC